MHYWDCYIIYTAGGLFVAMSVNITSCYESLFYILAEQNHTFTYAIEKKKRMATERRE